MKDGILRPDGQIACPKCGSTSYRLKRSAPAKLALGVSVGVFALAAPKRLKCLSCGELYRARADQVAPGTAEEEDDGTVLAIPPAASVPTTAAPATAGVVLVLHRTMALGPVLDIVAPLRPDLTREQVKELVKTTKTGPQRVATGPEPALRAALDRLAKLKVKAEIVPG